MDPDSISEQLNELRSQLRSDVVDSYQRKGREFGNSRFKSWKKRALKFFEQNLPDEKSDFEDALAPRHVFFIGGAEKSPATDFWEDYGERVYSYLESLVFDIDSGNYEFDIDFTSPQTPQAVTTPSNSIKRVFIVHGRNNEAKERTARFVEKLGYEAIILHEQASKGRTIIEKIEHYSDVPFAIVLYTPDDAGNTAKEARNGELNNRARQNVVFEHGYLISKIGRNNVACLVSPDVELPNDISGIVYISDDNWQLQLAKEMKHAGFEIDFNLFL